MNGAKKETPKQGINIEIQTLLGDYETVVSLGRRCFFGRVISLTNETIDGEHGETSSKYWRYPGETDWRS